MELHKKQPPGCFLFYSLLCAHVCYTHCMKFKSYFFLTLFFVAVFLFNGNVDFSEYQIDRVYLTVSTFLFSVFNGFFIARQSSRYNEIRNALSKFDGAMTIVYRESTHLSEDEHKSVATVIREYYKSALSHPNWSYYYFDHKTRIIQSLHELVDSAAKNGLDGLRGESIKNMLRTLDDVQIMRKLLVSLKAETIPKLQRVFMYLLSIALLLSVLTLPSKGLILASIIKALYVVSIVTVVRLLQKFDDLSLFEGNIGAHSATDALEILDGKK